jgi:hypothetical protein
MANAKVKLGLGCIKQFKHQDRHIDITAAVLQHPDDVVNINNLWPDPLRLRPAGWHRQYRLHLRLAMAFVWIGTPSQ